MTEYGDALKLRPQEPLIIAGEKWDLSFTRGEVKAIREMWSAGISLPDMAAQLRRQQEEIAVMVMELAQNAMIGRREQGVLGGEESREGCKGARKHG